MTGYKQLYGSCYVGYVKRLRLGFVKGRSPVVFKSRETASFPISFEMAGVSLTTLLHIVLSIWLLWPSSAFHWVWSNCLGSRHTKSNHNYSLVYAQPSRWTHIKVSFYFQSGLPLAVLRVFRHKPYRAIRRHSIGETRASARWSKPLIHTSKLMLAIEISMVEVRIMASWRPVLVNQIEFGQVFGTFWPRSKQRRRRELLAQSIAYFHALQAAYTHKQESLPRT